MHIQFIRQTEGFRDWLELLGYESSSVQNLPRVITRYLSYMETRKLKQISEISSMHTTDWYNKERQRKSRQTGQLLKNSTLNGINRTLRLFSRYLEETGQGILTIDIPYEEKEAPPRLILTMDEIKALYNATDETITGLRDRAMLSIYYGCGLRCKEGRYLSIEDVLTDRMLIHVRKGKHHMERYVPFVENQQTDFLLYLKECRPKLNVQNSKANTGDATKSKNTDWFFLNNKGEQVSSSFLLRRLRYLKTAAGIEKDIGLHGLRHSIATHLLSSGMPLESISRFLGHKNIESTQRYTHVETPEEIY